jgi:hypothetical protein
LVKAYGSCRGIFHGGLIRELDLVCDPELYNELAFSGT